MSAREYVAAAALAWLVGFLPLFEIYVAIPVGLATGLDPVSATFWAAFGNIVPLWLVDLGYERLRRIERVDHYLSVLRRERVERALDRFGFFAVILATPLLGVWTMALAAKGLGMSTRPFLLASTVSVAFYAVIVTLSIELGLELIAG
ncbi:MAG: small multi-drug export protein [Candidatus Limnocylindrales bacterium]